MNVLEKVYRHTSTLRQAQDKSFV